MHPIWHIFALTVMLHAVVPVLLPDFLLSSAHAGNAAHVWHTFFANSC